MLRDEVGPTEEGGEAAGDEAQAGSGALLCGMHSPMWLEQIGYTNWIALSKRSQPNLQKDMHNLKSSSL